MLNLARLEDVVVKAGGADKYLDKRYKTQAGVTFDFSLSLYLSTLYFVVCFRQKRWISQSGLIPHSLQTPGLE